MENENNKVHHGNRKNKFAKRKGYFITPPSDADKEIKINEAPASNQQAKKSGEHQSKQRNNAPMPQKQVQKQDENKKDHPMEQRKNKQKNRHKRPKNNNPQAQETEKTTTIPEKPIETPAAQSQKPQKKANDRLVIKPRTPVSESVDESEYEQIRFPSVHSNDNTLLVLEKKAPEDTDKESSSPMVEVVGIRFKSSGKTYYFAPNGNKLSRGDFAIVETARGQEYGEVAMANKMVSESETVPPLRPIVRRASKADTEHHLDNKKKEDDAFRLCNEKIIAHGLDMKLIDAQYTFDNSKLLFYFTSSGRVDFRELVKDLASLFRTRIELRQIGIRDEAKIMGGIGMCGRPLCCSRFLSDCGQVSIKMAKEQNLSLNSAKISGICGRLMCCLRYEHEAYEYEIKRTPPVDAFVKTADGTGTVTEISPLRGTVKVKLTSAPDAPPKTYKREDVVMLQKKRQKDENDPKSDNKEEK